VIDMHDGSIYQYGGNVYPVHSILFIMDGTAKALTVAVAALIMAVTILAVSIDVPDADRESGDAIQSEPVTDPVEGAADAPGTDPDLPDQNDRGVTIFPGGISFDLVAGLLTSESDIEWTITDELVPFIDKAPESFYGSKVPLGPGLYTVEASGETFHIVVDGTVSKARYWTYSMGGQTHAVSVTYGISISELADITLRNREWNEASDHVFSDLVSLVYVNDTVRSIASGLKAEYVRIGGDIDDVQSYADFLASFAQLGISYPTRQYTWMDENGDPVMVEGAPKKSTDYEVWGKEDYWANALETIFHGTGDCEDTAAVACSIFKAAGLDTAMVGIHGHAASSVALDSFADRDLDYYSDLLRPSVDLVRASGTSVNGDDRITIYYAVDTTSGQTPVGYLTAGPASILGEPTQSWGMSGFYPVQRSHR